MAFGARCLCKDKISLSTARYAELDPALCLELRKIVEALSAPGKGLLACDETPPSLDKRFQELCIENNETNRRDYRFMLFSANKFELQQYISGAILHHETVYQKTPDGIEMVDFLKQRNIISGIKVDKGLIDLLGTDQEKTTQGLDSLQERCIQYKKDGCHFAKWRCVYSITPTKPSELIMVTNAHVLARYASICQSARLVPIVEPEILSDGEHDINRALTVHEEVLSILFRILNEHKVYLEGIILKPAMVLPGSKNLPNCSPQVIGEYTVKMLQRTVPPAVPAILFLSGGQSDEQSVLNLNAINTYQGKKPWTMSFCYGRALQNTAMKCWAGCSSNVEAAQALFLERCKLCSQAALGKSEMSSCTN